jgi:D-glycero-alpha-D-manno-heptose-7-phosphate kinase
MILTRAPLRISYIGGGSDYPEFSNIHGGNVVGATIDKYVYVMVNELSEIANENLRFTYRQTESVMHFSEIQHPVVRELMSELGVKDRINIATFADLPSRVGLGGSSSFTAALIKAIEEFRGSEVSPHSIANIAVKIERINLKENGGLQDQFHASIGGFRHYRFEKNEISYSKPLLSENSRNYIEKRQLLVWSGESRNSAIPASVTQTFAIKGDQLMRKISKLAEKTAQDFGHTNSEKDHFDILVGAVRAGWFLKQEFTPANTNKVDFIIAKASLNGAKAFKLCGAGESGFVLILAEPMNIIQIQNSLPEFKTFMPRFESSGVSTLINI